MKKFFVMALAAVSLVACNDNEADNDADDTTVNSVDTTSTTNTTTTTTTNTTGYTPVDGDVTYQEKKVRVRRNGEWVDADDDVRMDNGVVVYRDGRVTRDDKEIELEEGEVVDRTGNFFDRSGRAIENAWDVTKEGAKDAGRAVKKTAKKVGEKVEKAVTDEDGQ